MKRLILIHGRSQEDKDALELKTIWVTAWQNGLAKSNLALPISEDRIRFIYYGNTLRDMCEGLPASKAADVIYRGANAGADDRERLQELLLAYLTGLGIEPAQVDAVQRRVTGNEVVERGPQNWAWVQAVIRTIDAHVPGAGTLIAMITNDVHQYLSKDSFRSVIEDGIIAALSEEEESVIVAHSLGTIVAYKLLHRLSQSGAWKVPVFVTLGSPLAINAIRERLRPIRHPSCVSQWYNARDPKDVVALYPLDRDHFKVTPEVDDSSHVSNWKNNRHGIEGYLDDERVARRIVDALSEG
ncbi:hypothetical protein FZO89_07840 [Luteimonas viscosa]|uniref:Alpha/beta hydrolase n=1 Tax=Luteimonas viscosa TaxID=1132694 RepID=A0A5D4XNC2_9GAMM|nr:hypothetical protein [Luteimonas viscosa]TYT26177.1 hypothetical protein FZO89_07840 [Luteimonas viscosa]